MKPELIGIICLLNALVVWAGIKLADKQRKAYEKWRKCYGELPVAFWQHMAEFSGGTKWNLMKKLLWCLMYIAIHQRVLHKQVSGSLRKKTELNSLASFLMVRLPVKVPLFFPITVLCNSPLSQKYKIIFPKLLLILQFFFPLRTFRLTANFIKK